MAWLNLPDLALIRVLNCLSVCDQLNARLVCRRWKLITDSSLQKEELILFLEIYPRPVYWFRNGKEVDLGNSFLISSCGALKNEFFRRFFRKVRRLIIVHRVNASSREFIKQIQASFLQLEHLQFCFFGCKAHLNGIRDRVYETNLHLPSLRTFYLQSTDMPRAFHCPKLTELFVYTKLDINETDEQTRSCIKNLRLLLAWKLSYPNGFEFSNLETLYLIEPSHSIALRDFPRLKELHYFHAFAIYFEFPNHLENLLEQRRSLERNQLRIYFDGFELDYLTGPEYLNDFVPPDTGVGYLDGIEFNELVLRHVKKVAPSSCKFNLLSSSLLMNQQVFLELIDLRKDDLVESMLKSVKEITFEEPPTVFLNFFEFSDWFRYISYVGLDVEMSQSQLDRLPDIFPHLIHFSYEPKFFSKQILNFRFISKFKSLHFLNFDGPISLEESRLIFEKCKFLNFVQFFRPNEALVRISRSIGEKIYGVKWMSSDSVRFARAKFTIEELFDYLEASRWFKKNDDFLGEREVDQAPLLLRRPNENGF